MNIPLWQKPAPFRIAIVYAFIGCAWILLSDLFASFYSSAPETLTSIQTLKGLAFIAATAILVYILTRLNLSEILKSRDTLLRKNRLLKISGECNHAIAIATDERDLLTRICEIIVKTGGYELVWARMAEQGKSEPVMRMSPGDDETPSDTSQIAMEKCRFGKSLATGKTTIIRNPLDNGDFNGCREEIMRRGVSAIISLPLIHGGAVLGAIDACYREDNGCGEDDVELLTDIAGNVAHGISALRLASEKQSAADALKESEERYRILIETVPYGVQESDLNGMIVYVNKTLASMLDVPENEIVGSYVWDFYASGFEKEAMRLYQQMLVREKPDPAPYIARYIRKSDGLIDTQVDWNYKRDNHGEVTGIISVLTDITERKQAENSVLESEEKYRRLSEASFEGIVIHESGRIVETNKTFGRMFGYGQGEITGMYAPNITTPKYREMIKRHIESGYERPYEIDGMRKDGSLFPAEVISKNVILRGRNMQITAIRDITQRKTAEEERNRLARAVDQSAEGVFITDVDGRFIYVNPAFERITGFPKSDVLGRKTSVLKSGKHDQRFYRDLWETITAGNSWSGHVINRKKDGAAYEADMIISPIADPQGRILNYVCVQRDATYESMLSRAREYFTSITSHELRTPLAKLELVRIMMRKVEETSLDKEKGSQIMSVLNETYMGFSRIITITSLLSELSFVRHRKAKDNVYLFAVTQFSLESVNSLIMQEKRKVKLLTDMDSLPVEIIIHGDYTMVKTAIEEMLSNAVKYTPDGKDVKIMAKLDGNEAIIEFTDEGIGIEQHHLERIFDPYFSLEDPMSHSTGLFKYKGGGMGLGLTVTKMIMEYHGGNVEIKSDGLGKGATVVLRFPLPTV